MMIENMTLEEKVGQLFMVGFQDKDHLKTLIEELHCGGYIYFKRNVEKAKDAKDLSQYIYDKSIVKPFISIDQEGGIVNRIKEGITHVPGQMATAATGKPENAMKVAEILSKEMKALGINMTLSPVLDINNNPNNPIINVRSFGETAEQVIVYGKEALKGYMDNQMIPVGKHFPGHGDTDMDSHLSLPIVNHSLERLEQVELKPYRALIEIGLPAIMVSHIVFPKISEHVPATLSHGVCTKLLRDRLGFDGLIMTDCMEMDAVDKHFDIADAAVMSLKAGVDQVLISHTFDKQKRAFDRVLEAVKSGELSEDEVDEKVNRIMALKDQLTDESLSFNKEAHEMTIKEIYSQSVSVFKQGDLPIAEGETLWLIPEPLKEKGYFDSLKDDCISYNEYSKGLELKYSTIILCSNGEVENLNGIDNNRLIHVSLQSPYDLNLDAKAALCTYECNEHAISTAIDLIYGKTDNLSVLPVTLERRRQ